MRVSVNLATRPFVELRPFFLRLRLLMIALAVTGLALAIGAHVLSVKAERQKLDLDRLRDQTIAAQEAKLHTEQRLRQPANAAILDRAHFLNTLFIRKSFSWTAVMMDLENVLPNGVQVTSIEPAVTADGQVLIRLRVAGARDQAIQLVRNLERSRRFLQPRLGSEAAQTRETAGTNARPGMPGPTPAPAGPSGVEFEILANYNPLPPGEPYAIGHRAPTAAVATEATPTSEATPEPTPALPSPGVSIAERSREVERQRAANLRHGYPPNGVVLPLHPSPTGTGARSMPPVGAQRGGGAR